MMKIGNYWFIKKANATTFQQGKMIFFHDEKKLEKLLKNFQ